MRRLRFRRMPAMRSARWRGRRWCSTWARRIRRHGVLRIVLELDGETITRADPDIGYLHRGDEKIAEHMTYNQFVPHTRTG